MNKTRLHFERLEILEYFIGVAVGQQCSAAKWSLEISVFWVWGQGLAGTSEHKYWAGSGAGHINTFGGNPPSPAAAQTHNQTRFLELIILLNTPNPTVLDIT